MRILHTSDWHIGRTFHGHSTLENLSVALDGLVDAVRERDVDVVLVSGDVFDQAMPAADAIQVLTSTLSRLHQAGATVIMISGNHDSATRLGYLSEFAGLAGIHILTRHDQHDRPITLSDEHGPVHFYGIPYLEPALIRHHYPDAELRNHEQVLGFVMDRIRADANERGGRSVVLSHCFAVGVPASDVERDITAGGVEYVPLEVFDGIDYVALGHIHGRAKLSARVRYSGAPLHYSFSEAGKPRGAWLVELTEGGVEDDRVQWVDVPVPKPLSVITGELEEVLTCASYSSFEHNWVSAILTDQVRPMDAMRRLQERFPGCVTLEHRPAFIAESDGARYVDRVNKKTDHEIVAGFLAHVRNGRGPSEVESAIIAEVVSAVTRVAEPEPAVLGNAKREADVAGEGEAA